MPKKYEALFPSQEFARKFMAFCEEYHLNVDFETGEGLNRVFRTLDSGGAHGGISGAFYSGNDLDLYRMIFLEWQNAITEFNMLVFDNKQEPHLMYYSGDGKLQLSGSLYEIGAEAVANEPQLIEKPQPFTMDEPKKVRNEPIKPQRTNTVRPKLGFWKNLFHTISGHRWFHQDYLNVLSAQRAWDDFENSPRMQRYNAEMEAYTAEKAAMTAYKTAKGEYDAKFAAYERNDIERSNYFNGLSRLQKTAKVVFERKGMIDETFESSVQQEFERQQKALDKKVQDEATQEYDELTANEQKALKENRVFPQEKLEDELDDELEKYLDKIFADAEKGIEKGFEDNPDDALNFNRADFILIGGEILNEVIAGHYEDTAKAHPDWPKDYKEFSQNKQYTAARNRYIVSFIKWRAGIGKNDGSVREDPMVVAYPPDYVMKRLEVPYIINQGYYNPEQLPTERLEDVKPHMELRDISLEKIDENIARMTAEAQARTEAIEAAKAKAARDAYIVENKPVYQEKLTKCFDSIDVYLGESSPENLVHLNVGKAFEAQITAKPPEQREADMVALPTGVSEATIAKNIKNLLDVHFAPAEKTLMSEVDMELDRSKFIYINGKSLYDRAKDGQIKNIQSTEVMTKALLSAARCNYHIEVYTPTANLEVNSGPTVVNLNTLANNEITNPHAIKEAIERNRLASAPAGPEPEQAQPQPAQPKPQGPVLS